MKVITGTAKGRKLITLPDDSIRPTTDFVKQAIFNSIQFDIEGRHVLDLFAGSGQLGIEALSRGAASADFVDSSRAAADIVKKNLEHCGLSDMARVHQCGAASFLQRATHPYDLVFMDPPYKSDLLSPTFQEMIRIDILRIGGIIVCEYAGSGPPEANPPYIMKSCRQYGGKSVALYTKSPADGAAV